jgi:DNA-binding SARP family transcriptional activator
LSPSRLIFCTLGHLFRSSISGGTWVVRAGEIRLLRTVIESGWVTVVITEARRHGGGWGNPSPGFGKGSHGRRLVRPLTIAVLTAWLILLPAGIATSRAAAADKCDKYGLWSTNCRVMSWRTDLLKKQLGAKDKPKARTPKAHRPAKVRKAPRRVVKHRATPRQRAAPRHRPVVRHRVVPRRQPAVSTGGGVVNKTRQMAGRAEHTVEKSARRLGRAAGKHMPRPVVPRGAKVPAAGGPVNGVGLGQMPGGIVAGVPVPGFGPGTAVIGGRPGLTPPDGGQLSGPIEGKGSASAPDITAPVASGAPATSTAEAQSARTRQLSSGAGAQPYPRTEKTPAASSSSHPSGSSPRSRGLVAEAFDGTSMSRESIPSFAGAAVVVAMAVLLQMFLTHRRRQIVAAVGGMYTAAFTWTRERVQVPSPRMPGRPRRVLGRVLEADSLARTEPVGLPQSLSAAGASAQLAVGRDTSDHDVSVDLFRVRGLGLRSRQDSAEWEFQASASVLLALVLARVAQGAKVVVPQVDFDRMLAVVGGDATELPHVTVTSDLGRALIEVQAELVERVRRTEVVVPPIANDEMSEVLLVCSPGEAAEQVRAVLAQGAPYGIGGFLLGEWPYGLSVAVDDLGTVTAATGIGSEALRNATLFTVYDRAEWDRLLGLLPPPPPAVRESSTADLRGVVDTDSDHEGPLASVEAHQANEELTRTEETGHGADSQVDARPRVNEPAPTRPLVAVMGPLEMSRRGRPWQGSMKQSMTDLTGYLGRHHNTDTSRKLSLELWPASTRNCSATPSTFYDAVSMMREALRSLSDEAVRDGKHPRDYLGADRKHKWGFRPADIDLDVWQYDKALEEARHAEDASDALAALDRAVALWRGDYADGSEGRWVDLLRKDLTASMVRALCRIGDLRKDVEPGRALAALERAIRLDNCAEEAYRRLMAMFIAQGRIDEVHDAWRHLTTCLAADARRPSAEMLALYEGLTTPPTEQTRP